MSDAIRILLCVGLSSVAMYAASFVAHPFPVLFGWFGACLYFLISNLLRAHGK